jgi:hypothetical protein
MRRYEFTGHAFTISPEADGPDALHVRRSAVIRLIGRPNLSGSTGGEGWG